MDILPAGAHKPPFLAGRKGTDMQRTLVSCLTKAQRALLAIQQLVSTIRIFSPVHHIQREPLTDGVNDRLLFGITIDKFALVWRADVQITSIGNYASLLVILKTGEDVGYCDFNGVIFIVFLLPS